MADSLLHIPQSDTAAVVQPAETAPLPLLDSLLTLDETSFGQPWRDASAAEVYGTTSATLPASGFIPSSNESLTHNPLFQSFVLLLAALFGILLYRNIGDVMSLAGRMSRNAASGKNLTDQSGGSSFSRFLNIVTAIGIMFTGIAVVKYGELLAPALTDALPHYGAVLLIAVAGSVVGAVIALYQWLILHIVNYVTLHEELTRRLLLSKRIFFSLGVIATSPALLMFVLCPSGEGGLWFFVIAVVFAVTLILYLREILNLFLEKKISILHWFLYLCTVEILPLSLVWFLLTRESA